MSEIASCKTCGEAVEWVITENGKRMPIDREPVSYGGFVLEERSCGKVAVHISKVGQDYRGQRYASHFQTCPQREQHRRPR